MKVLWFTNSSVSAQKRIDPNFVGESWIGALERYLIEDPDIQLAIAFNRSGGVHESFEIESVKYFSIPRRTGRFKRKFGIGNRYEFKEEEAVKDYLNVILGFKPDIIQIFGSENNFGLLIPHVKIPVIIHIQGNITVYNQKYFSGISKLDVLRYSKWKDFLKGSTFLHQFKILKKIESREKKIFRYCKYFLGRTRWDRNIARILSPDGKYFHCEEVLRNEFFINKWEIKNEERIKLISVIRGHIYKGLETVMEVATLLKEVGLLFEWVIVGNSKTFAAPEIFEKKYKKSFSDVNVNFLGSKNGCQLIELIMASTFYIHPSHIENSPNAVCEAMILGVPVIATAVGGTSSILKDSEEGILVQDGDAYAMAGAILELNNDKSLQNKFSKNARERALQRHDPLKIVKELKRIYADIIQDYNSKKESESI